MRCIVIAISASTSYLLQMFTYKGFKIANADDAEPNDLKNTVDDFMDSIVPVTTPDEGIKHIDAARIAMACAAACSMLVPLARAQQCARAGPAAVFAPNRIQRRHLTTDSRLRNLMHGGILGTLARQLTRDPTQHRQWNQRKNALCVIQRANSAAGCAHVKWSIPEFQCAFNIGVKRHKTSQNPLNALNNDDAMTQFNLLDTAENRNAFLAKCKALVGGANQSRVVYPMDPADVNVAWTTHRPIVVDDERITDFVFLFAKLCTAKMTTVNNPNLEKMDRSIKLIDLYRFIARIEWILNDPNVRCVLNVDRFREAHIKRLIYMAEQGIEHSAYMIGRSCPEMMTPELYVCVVPTPEFYMVPQLQIQLDDDVFGPMKVACQTFMPEPVPALPPVPVRRRCYSDSDSDDEGYYSDGTDDMSDEDDDDDYHNDDDGDSNVSG